MDRRSFVAALAALAALLPIGRFKSVTRISINHDGTQPVHFTATGVLFGPADQRIVEYTAASPFRGVTPAAITSLTDRGPIVIQAEDAAFIRVVADHPNSQQHLVARANRVTVRLREKSIVSVAESELIEIIGEAPKRR